MLPLFFADYATCFFIIAGYAALLLHTLLPQLRRQSRHYYAATLPSFSPLRRLATLCDAMLMAMMLLLIFYACCLMPIRRPAAVAVTTIVGYGCDRAFAALLRRDISARQRHAAAAAEVYP